MIFHRLQQCSHDYSTSNTHENNQLHTPAESRQPRRPSNVLFSAVQALWSLTMSHVCVIINRCLPRTCQHLIHCLLQSFFFFFPVVYTQWEKINNWTCTILTRNNYINDRQNTVAWWKPLKMADTTTDYHLKLVAVYSVNHVICLSMDPNCTEIFKMFMHYSYFVNVSITYTKICTFCI